MMQHFSLTLIAPIDKWDEAIPLGNGIDRRIAVGVRRTSSISLSTVVIYGTSGYILPIMSPGLTYETIKRMALAGLADSLE